MTDTPIPPTGKRPLVTSTGLITGALAFTFPFIADRLIVAAMEQIKDPSIGSVVGLAVYTAAPFLLLDSAMRPRRRVRLALWAGLALTALVWAAFAQTGRAAQLDAAAGNANIALFIVTMIWPVVVTGLMGAAAKIGDPEHDT